MVGQTLGRPGRRPRQIRCAVRFSLESEEGGVAMHSCPSCGVELSPWEGDHCMGCSVTRPVGRLSNADPAVLVLEQEASPVTTYDVARGIRRELGWTVTKASLTVSLSSDHRICWAGRNLYDLLRHGIFPGSRNLAGVAKLFLYSHAKPLDGELLWFVMHCAGYRFRPASLRNALSWDEAVSWKFGSGWRVPINWTTRATLRRLGVRTYEGSRRSCR